MAAPSPCASPATRALATSFPAALHAHSHPQPPQPQPPQTMPTIPEEDAPAARMTVDTRLAADAAVMESPVLTGRRSPPPVSSPSVTKLPGLELAMRSSTKRELLLPALSAARAAGASASPSAIFSSLTPPPPSQPQPQPPTKREGESAAAAARRKKGTRRGTLHPEAKNVLKAWMFSPEHFAHPYPSEEEKEELASEAGIEVKQLSNWFTNARKRLWQPVLRQSGVEVKNFLSTGRGGPRGNKLEVPANLQQLVASSLAAATADDSPPSSPGREDGDDSDASMRSPLKRSWSDVQASLLASPAASADEAPAKRKKAPAAGKKRRAQELRLVLADKAASASRASPFPFPPGDASPASVARFRDVELLAASSLLGLHQQPYQPVH